MTILTDSNFSTTFDAVVMLTVSDWHTEPRSNRYHYATRFARRYRVIFAQADREAAGYAFELSGYPEIEILHLPKALGAAQTTVLAEALAARRILRPLFWIYSANYVHAVENIFSPLRIFHATEDYFSDELKSQLLPGYFERLVSLFKRLDLLIAVSEGVLASYLYKGGFRGNTLLLENGCDFSFWRKIIDAEPFAQAPLAQVAQAPLRPVAFYQGGINYRFDYALLTKLASSKPDWDFRLCGVCFGTDYQWSKLLGMANVSYLGILRPEQIAVEAANATVGLIPFVATSFVQQKSLPLKAFEYVACGLPVVSVPIDSLKRWPEIFLFASTASEFGERMEQARAVRQDPSAISRRLELAAQQDYDRRFDTLMSSVPGLLKIPAKNTKQKLNILFLYSSNSTYTATVHEYLSSFAKFSQHSIVFAEGVRGAPCDYSMSQFDVILVHYSVRLILDDYISPAVVDELKRCGSYKALFIQDEYEYTERARRWIDEIGFHAIFSCVPNGQISKVYPPDRFKSTEFSSILTGYVPETLEHRRFGLPLGERSIVLGYRGRKLPFRFGQLGQEKYMIGLKMREICENRGIQCDIEWDEDKRIYGDKWYEFIGKCRAMLGTESGSNVFDFDGALHLETDEVLRRLPHMTFNEFHAQFLRDIDENIRMNQISPRVFEAIAIGTPLVLFEGNYSGVVRPGEHFILLKKDFSNVQEVLNALEDIDALQAMADRAWRQVIGSGDYSYRTFVANIDEFLHSRVKSTKPWLALSVAIGQVRCDSNSFSTVANLNRGAAVSWPLPYQAFSEQTDLAATNTTGPGALTVNYFPSNEDVPNYISARTLIVILARRCTIRMINCAPFILRGYLKDLLRKIAIVCGIIKRA